jgi:hypothetical protein
MKKFCRIGQRIPYQKENEKIIGDKIATRKKENPSNKLRLREVYKHGGDTGNIKEAITC